MPSEYLSLLISASALVVSVVSFFCFRSYIKRRTGQERILAEFREEVNNIIASINETVDRDISLIEDREKNLRALLKDIDKRVKVYLLEAERSRSAEALSQSLLPEAPEKKNAPSNGTYVELGKLRYRGAAPLAPQDEAAPAEEAAAGAEAASSVSGDTPSDPLPVGEQIRQLVKAGLSVPLIASRLGISIAEAEFAAALLERRDA